MWFDTFEDVVISNDPTKITNVTIEEIGEDYAIVSFKTNHPAWGKVNYGETLSYGEEIFMMERSYDHKAKNTSLRSWPKTKTMHMMPITRLRQKSKV